MTEKAKTVFVRPADAIEYIDECEGRFRALADGVAERILSDPALRLIGLSGPSCSGKTTTAELLIRRLKSGGKNVQLISIDNFFRDRLVERRQASSMKFDEKLDFDSIDALDFPLFSSFLSDLMTTGHAKMPIYSIGHSKRVGWQDISAGRDDLCLFEGIQVVYPEIDRLLRAYPYRSIFIRAGHSLRVGDVTFDPNEIRLLRRLVRDYFFRRAAPEFTFRLWEGVRENEERSILPYADTCDEQLDSVMGYEIGILRPHLEKILETIPPDSVYRKTADGILDDLKMSGAQALDAAWLPDDALYREFVRTDPYNED